MVNLSGPTNATVADGQMGHWARLSSENGSDIIANDVKQNGSMYLRVVASDACVEIRGVTFHKVG